MTEKKPPLHSFKEGGLSIKIWEQQGKDDQLFTTATISKHYKDKSSGEWRESRSLSDADLLKLQAMLPQAREAMQQHREQQRSEQLVKQPVQDMAAERDSVLYSATRFQKSVPHTPSHAPTPTKGRER